MVVGHEEENVMFIVRKIVALTSTQMINNKRPKNFGNKTENFLEIKANITHF